MTRCPGRDAAHSWPTRPPCSIHVPRYSSPVVCAPPRGSMASSRFRTVLALAVTLAFLLGLPFDTSAGGGGRSGIYSPRASASGSTHRSALSSSRSTIKRDPNAVSEFKRTHPTLPGYHQCEVDHIVPLRKGGRDDPSNLPWLPREPHREQTRRDRSPWPLPSRQGEARLLSSTPPNGPRSPLRRVGVPAPLPPHGTGVPGPGK